MPKPGVPGVIVRTGPVFFDWDAIADYISLDQSGLHGSQLSERFNP